MTSWCWGDLRDRREGLLARSEGWGCRCIRGGLTCAALAVAILVVSLSVTAGAFAADNATISGHVTNAADEALPNICVSAQLSPPGPGGSFAQTDASGNYTISGLAAGSYTVQFSACPGGGNYVTEWWNNQPDFTTADTISLAAGASRTDIDAQLATAATISGHVTSTANEALQHICVKVYRSTAQGGTDQFTEIIAQTGTDASGNYAVPGLAAGSYKVVLEDCGTGLGLATSFYHDRPDLGSADPITVTAGQTVTGIDAQMIVGGAISGHVTNASANPLGGVCVAAELPTTGAIVTGALTGADGSYTLTGLAPGSYKVHFLTVNCPFATAGDYAPQWYKGKADAASADPVAVTAAHTTQSIDAQMAPTNTTGLTGTSGQAQTGQSGQAAPSPTPAPTVKLPSNVFTIASRITLKNGITVLTVNVPGPGVLTATQSAPATVRSTTARAATGRPFAPLITTVRLKVKKKGNVALQLKGSAAGKKILRKRGKFTAKVRVTFTPVGGKPRSVFKKVTVKRVATHTRH
jgi:Carboxypeptidase regulatory-like domain